MQVAIKIALIWLSIFDKHRLLFKTIKPLNKWFRYFLYVITNIINHNISINYVYLHNNHQLNKGYHFLSLYVLPI